MNEKLFKGSNKWAKDNGKMTSKQRLMNSLQPDSLKKVRWKVDRNSGDGGNSGNDNGNGDGDGNRSEVDDGIWKKSR